MGETKHDELYERTVQLCYSATWVMGADVHLCDDVAATRFGPSATLEPGEQPPLFLFDDPKYVRWVPVKKSSGTEHVPSLSIEIKIWEYGFARNVDIPSLAGKTVNIEVRNVFEGLVPAYRKPDKLEGKLDAQGHCLLKIPAAKVAEWINPKKPFGGRINETLLDFFFEIPSVKSSGSPLKGQSQVRVYLYRRKALVFLPGVFGSQVLVNTPDGRTLGFPDFYDETLPPYTGKDSDLGLFLAQLFRAKDAKVGGLECDEDGRALVEPMKPTLVSLRGQIYKVFGQMHDARAKWFRDVPEDMALFQIWLHCYDWRLDLTEAAFALADRLATLQADLRKRPDYDDEIALAGHSTGGLIIRRALGLDGMSSRVSHAFFLNVPFQGAPKALGVILSGQDPPGGDRMIPIVTAESIRDVALSMPIVYHLAAARSFGRRVGFCAARPVSASVDVEADKKAVTEAGLAAGFMPRPMAVRSTVTDKTQRAKLAATSDAFHKYWIEASERHRGDPVYEKISSGKFPKHYDFFTDHESQSPIKEQLAARKSGGWNATLASKAAAFHDASEKIAASGKWASKAFVFYSISDHPTTLDVTVVEDAKARRHASSESDLKDGGYWDMLDGDLTPDRGDDPVSYTGPDDGATRQGPSLWVRQWTSVPTGYDDRKFVAYGRAKTRAGDGTVPIRSLRGFGGPATIFKPIPGGPMHVPAPNAAYVWQVIVRTLQGVTWDNDVEVSPEDYGQDLSSATGS